MKVMQSWDNFDSDWLDEVGESRGRSFSSVDIKTSVPYLDVMQFYVIVLSGIEYNSENYRKANSAYRKFYCEIF